MPWIGAGHASAHRWCLVMSENRPREKSDSYWALTAAINEEYAAAHDYGFAYIRYNGTCIYDAPERKSRVRMPTWCKVPAVAHVLLRGIEHTHRRCDNVLFLDSDAHVSNPSLSIDAYLERARDHGDDALQDANWELLFSSNYWWDPDSLCAGVWFVRATNEACGILRFWWESSAPAYDTKNMHEQGVMRSMIHFNRPWGQRVRLMPTARFFRREDSQWRRCYPCSWKGVMNHGKNAPAAPYWHDDFIHHGLKSSPYDIALLRASLAAAERRRAAVPTHVRDRPTGVWTEPTGVVHGGGTPSPAPTAPQSWSASTLGATGGSAQWLARDHHNGGDHHGGGHHNGDHHNGDHPTGLVHGGDQHRHNGSAIARAPLSVRLAQEVVIDARILAQTFSSAAGCPLPTPRVEIPNKDFARATTCCTQDTATPHSRTHINGTRSDTPRPCWAKAPWVTIRPSEEWVCGATT